jgi:hypothetical protein
MWSSEPHLRLDGVSIVVERGAGNLPSTLLALWAVFGNMIGLVADLASTRLTRLLALLLAITNTMTCKV